MRRTLIMVGFIWVMCLAVCLAQASPDVSQAQTPQVKAEEIKKDEAKSEQTADKSQTKEDAEKQVKVGEKEVTVEKKAEAKSAEKDKEAKTEAAAAEKTSEDKQKQAEKSEKKAAEKSATEKKPKVVCITLSEDYPEGPTAVDFFSQMRPSLSDLIGRIDAVAKDKEVAALWLKVEDAAIGRGKINEIRAAIARVRKAKKPVYAELTTADAQQYLVACACDEIFMPESGMLIIPGVRAEIMFYKGLLDKIGVKFEDLKMGKYKGGFEPLTRRDMSQPFRESIEALVDDIYNNISTSIAADRGINDLVVKSLMDHGIYTAKAAKEAGLIDQVIYADQFEKELKKKLKAESLDIVTKYKSKSVEADFSGFGGFLKLVEAITGGRAKAETAGKKDKIAVVYAVGTIMEGKSSSELFGEQVLGSKTLIAALRKAAENPKVAAIVLRIDSPGGSATASDLIWRETVQMEKPLIASMGDVAGSGGYYIAMGAKKIYAEPGTLTGSIGVLGGKAVLKGLYDKLGLDTEVISRGANSSMLSTTQGFTPEQRRIWKDMLGEVYHQFVSKAAKGRNMSYEKLERLAQGRVYTGSMAKKIGLVDELGTLDDAITAAKVAAGLKPDADVDLLILPQPKSIFEQLFGDPSSDVETAEEIALPPALDIQGQVKLIRQFFSEPVLMWMPYKVEIK
jgi:protease-4